MSLSMFGEKAFLPDDEMLAGVLMDSKVFWDSIKNHVAKTYGNVSDQWKYYSKSAGWTLVIKSSERTIVYLIPLKGCFKANFVFGEKAVIAAKNTNLPEAVIALILEAKPNMEGRSFMIDVKNEADLDTVIKLIEIKSRI